MRWRSIVVATLMLWAVASAAPTLPPNDQFLYDSNIRQVIAIYTIPVTASEYDKVNAFPTVEVYSDGSTVVSTEPQPNRRAPQLLRIPLPSVNNIINTATTSFSRLNPGYAGTGSLKQCIRWWPLTSTYYRESCRQVGSYTAPSDFQTLWDAVAQLRDVAKTQPFSPSKAYFRAWRTSRCGAARCTNIQYPLSSLTTQAPGSLVEYSNFQFQQLWNYSMRSDILLQDRNGFFVISAEIPGLSPLSARVSAPVAAPVAPPVDRYNFPPVSRVDPQPSNNNAQTVIIGAVMGSAFFLFAILLCVAAIVQRRRRAAAAANFERFDDTGFEDNSVALQDVQPSSNSYTTTAPTYAPAAPMMTNVTPQAAYTMPYIMSNPAQQSPMYTVVTSANGQAFMMPMYTQPTQGGYIMSYMPTQTNQ